MAAALITEPGVYDVPAEVYHADDLCAAPCFSRSIGKLLIRRSPRHAWTAHPRLNPDHEPDDATKFDVGKAAHRLLLGGPEEFAIVAADDYRTKAAKEAREEALAAGRLPVLARQWEDVQAMVASCRAQLAAHEDAKDAFSSGEPEQTMVWQEGETWCKARLDWLPSDGRFFDDFKTTGNAHPDAWSERVAFETGADMQAALYRRGIRALGLARDPLFRFVVQEIEAPYALSVCALTPAAIDMADRELDRALELWRWCLENDSWPGYPARTCYVDPPPWQERRRLDAEAREEIARDNGEDLRTRMLDWQAPFTTAAE